MHLDRTGSSDTGNPLSNFKKVAKNASEVGAVFESANSITELMTDPSPGTFHKDVLDETVLSAILEFPL